MKRRLLALLLGLIALFVASEGLLAAGGRGWSRASFRRQVEAAREGGLRIACVGESTTAVAGDAAGRALVSTTAWPAQLEATLRARDPGRDHRVANLGVMAGTTGLAVDALEAALPELRPQIIVVMMGMKDRPAAATPAAGLRSLRLFGWLREAHSMEGAAPDPEHIPASMDEMSGAIQAWARETRLVEPRNRAALADLRAAAWQWYLGRNGRAEALLRRSIAEHDAGHALLARVLATAGRPEEARAVLAAAILRHPEEAMLELTLAELEAEGGDPAAAEARLRALLADIGSHHLAEIVEGHVRVALAELLRADDPEAALALLEEVRPGPPDGPHRLVLPPLAPLVEGVRARARLDLGEIDAAQRTLEAMLREDPADHEALWLLSGIYRRKGRLAEEAELRRRLLRSTGRMSDHLELAQLFHQTGRPARAAEVMAEGVARVPSVGEGYARLQRLAEDAGARVVVLQYPGFAVELLDAYAPAREGWVRVDEEAAFDRVADGGWFEPRRPHAFSHFSEGGARAVAEAAADAIRAAGF